MLIQPDILTLPLPYCWFEADTSLPGNRFNKKFLGEGLEALRVASSRTARPVSKVEQTGDHNTLDGAQRSFDKYFLVARVNDTPVPVYQNALSQVIKASFEDLSRGNSLSDKDLQCLAVGLHRLADWAQFTTEIPEAVETDEAEPASALFRWKQQHHLFFVIIHGMLYLLHVLEEALDKNHAPVVRSILQDFAELMEASEVAFRVASDFDQEAYDSEIRPDMHAHDPHFSGLFYADHKELITRLRVLRRVSDDFVDEMERIDAAITESYEAHALVCLRFVGKTSSLASKDDTRVAAESIRQKYVNRTKAIAGFGKRRT